MVDNALEDAQRKRRLKKLDPNDLGEIHGVLNNAGERIDLSEPLQVTTTLESWMLKLEFCLKHSVSKTLAECYHDYEA